jgi:hypothetical protein
VVEGLGIFWEIRNRIVHSAGDLNSDFIRAEVSRAIELGIRLLRGVDEIPREIHIVQLSNMDVFADSEGTAILPEVRAILVENTHSKTGDKTSVILPTTRLSYRPGDQVGWKFSFRRTWDEAWYRDPSSNEIRPAWTSAAEFVGDTIDQIVGRPEDG